jgi:prepilin signal peptidase PulO-like enzyme (type II secretory pathway)
MTNAIAAFVLAPGLALGSFLNVVAARLPKKQSLVKPRSACTSCGSEIAWYDNVPVISYAVLRGKCRNCGTKIGLVYPAVELATALLFAACVFAFGVSLEALAACVFCAALVVVTATDFTHRIVPNVVVLPGAVVVLGLMTAAHPSVEWIAASLGASFFLLVAAIAKPGGMGMGDVKLALLMGAALGRTVPVALFLGMLFALLPAVVLFARHGSKARKMAIPFAPFLALGSLVALFGGHAILHAWLHH